MKLTLRSDRVLTGGEIIPAEIVVEKGIIEDIKSHSDSHGIDLGDMLITPGFVDVHSDAIEKELEPRPGAFFPIEQSIIGMDKKLAIAGVTTMFHALAFETRKESELRKTEFTNNMVRTMKRMNSEILRVDNKIHARFEISSISSVETIENLLKDGLVDLFSVMDHAPGQGQFQCEKKWEEFYGKSYEMSRKELDALKAQKLNKDDKKILEMIDLAHEKGVSIASHDDCTIDKVKSMKDLGVTISEFPLSLDVAVYAKENGLFTGMGAPNIVRGGSQSGNIAAKELVINNACDYLCSDYHPISLLNAVYVMRDTLGLPLEEGFKMVTSNPAQMSGLTDRGEISIGKRADLAVIDDSYLPSVLMTLCGGKIIHNMTGRYCYDLHRIS